MQEGDGIKIKSTNRRGTHPGGREGKSQSIPENPTLGLHYMAKWGKIGAVRLEGPNLGQESIDNKCS
jgi:hypothetical protein